MNEACGSREDTVSCFPEQPINVRLNLNLPAYANRLNINNGWIYINEQQIFVPMKILLWRFGITLKLFVQVMDRNGFYKMELQ